MTRNQSPHQQSIEQLAAQAYDAIALAYPVCAASDEFYFFPQVVVDEKDWRVWDDFSQGHGEFFADRLQGWEARADALACCGGRAEAMDAGLLQTALRTLREQLVEYSPQNSQPTFHLTIVAAGLSEALESDRACAWVDRIAGLPEFLRRATACLETVPQLFLESGLAMAADLRSWLARLQTSGFLIGDALTTLDLFSAELKRVPVQESFLLGSEQFGRLVQEHLCCGLDLEAIRCVLEIEQEEMEELLQSEAARLVPGRRWQELEGAIPFLSAPEGDLLKLYRPELERMEAHVRRSGLIPPELQIDLAPELSEVPENLTAIRASDAYGARPGYPARGGTFYVYSHGEMRNREIGRTLEYRMTAAHEAWPGHHLLDVCRWSLPQAVRRPIERPLCYEGWACLAEELMARSGYFDGDWDRFLLARRRIERAVRGLVDLGLQSGSLNLQEAMSLLVAIGYSPQRAMAVVPKYALRPGYQICYSLGLKKNLALLDRFGATDYASFSRALLRQGQIGFAELESVLVEEGVE